MISKDKLAKGLVVYFAYDTRDVGIIVSKRTVHSVAKRYITLDLARGERYEHAHLNEKFHETPMEAMQAFVNAMDRNVKSLREQMEKKQALADRARLAMQNTQLWKADVEAIYVEQR